MTERSLTVTWEDPAELALLEAIVAGELPPAFGPYGSTNPRRIA